jgi:hypothetical protein
MDVDRLFLIDDLTDSLGREWKISRSVMLRSAGKFNWPVKLPRMDFLPSIGGSRLSLSAGALPTNAISTRSGWKL